MTVGSFAGSFVGRYLSCELESSVLMFKHVGICS